MKISIHLFPENKPSRGAETNIAFPFSTMNSF